MNVFTLTTVLLMQSIFYMKKEKGNAIKNVTDYLEDIKDKQTVNFKI